MHVTACLAGQKADVEVGEDCRTTQALREAIVVALPQLCVDGFDVSVGGRELNDEGVVSLEENVALDVSANARGLSVLALREAGHEVSEAGLRQAAEQGDVGLCTLYLDAGVPSDCEDGDCWTPLFFSCRGGHVETARLLLDRGAAIDERDRWGRTPLFLSCDNGHVETATLLLDRGSAAIDTKQNHGRTPLFVSCGIGYLETARLLLDRGAAIDEKDSYGRTPLFISCRNGHLATATLLLDRGSAAIDEKDTTLGWTPFHISCRHEYVVIARLLLDRGSTALVETYKEGRDGFSEEVVRFLSDRMGEQ